MPIREIPSKEDKKVYCTAGMNYVLIYPNGDVYRCMSDYGYKQLPLFNVKDGWSSIDKPLLCPHDKCESDCDLDWATKWVVIEDKNERTQILRSRFNHYVPIEESLFPEQTVFKKQENCIHIIWVPTLRCNYNCKYCAITFDKNRNQCPSANPELPTSEWFDIWEEIYNKYNHVSVSITGGEPFLSKATIPILAMISDKFSIDITSNLSINTNVMGIVRSGIKPGSDKGIRFITGSLHPTAQGFNKDLFFGSLLYLKNHGFAVGVNFVGYPLQLFLASEYKEICDKYGISFNVGVWTGYDSSGFRPRYTDIEKKYIDNITQTRDKVKQNAVKFRTFDYVIKTDTDKIESEEGDIVSIYAKIKNIGDFVWLNNEEGTFEIGTKILRYGDEEYALKEFRTAFEKNSLAPGDSSNFEIKIDTKGLMRGVYFLKIDIVKENEFWFEERGAEPHRMKLTVLKSSLSSEIIEVSVPTNISEKDIFQVKIEIKNTGNAKWARNEGIRVGGRLYRKSDQLKNIAIREFRAELPREVNSGELCDVEMNVDFSGLKPNTYTLIIDMVNEGKFWFKDKESQPRIVDIALLL